jgi:diadenosine tetraphosphate (Ap4A) HIT family hydrolase
MSNATMEKFGYPATLIREFEYWVVLLRPAQVTLGSLVLAAKDEATAFGSLPAAAHAELAAATRQIEATLSTEIGYDRINYLMLMMVDPHVHFHIFPRYANPRSFGDLKIDDSGWPGAPDLASGQTIPADVFKKLKCQLSEKWDIF